MRIVLLISFLTTCKYVFCQTAISGTNNILKNRDSFEYYMTKQLTNKIENLEFIDFENNTISINENHSQPYVLNIWASWCRPCVADIPEYNKLMNFYKECNVKFYALSYIEDTISTSNFLKNHLFNFKQVLASKEYIKKHKLANGLPTTLFVDDKGAVLYKFMSSKLTSENFKEGLKKLGCR
jgi:thiol-disulfide isomerase/thioredoxin